MPHIEAIRGRSGWFYTLVFKNVKGQTKKKAIDAGAAMRYVRRGMQVRFHN